MQVISVNIATKKTIQINNKSSTTGIFKHPVAGKVSINSSGLVGDTVVNTTCHGGVDQAVYLYSCYNGD